MGKEKFKIEGTVERSQMVDEIRKAARQFAMLYFHFCYTLYKQFGLEKTKEIVRQMRLLIRFWKQDFGRPMAAMFSLSATLW